MKLIERTKYLEQLKKCSGSAGHKGYYLIEMKRLFVNISIMFFLMENCPKRTNGCVGYEFSDFVVKGKLI